MARKRATEAKPDPEQRLIDAALTLAASQGWGRTPLAAIARAAGLPLHEAYALHPSKQSIVAALGRRIDRQVLAAVGVGEEEASRDRLFDVLMARFDALQPHRPALRSMLRDSLRDPLTLLNLPGLLRSMGWMLEAAGVSTAGWRGRLRVQALACIYLSLLRVFLEDDSSDLAKTMAALDRRLRRAETCLGAAGPQPAAAVSAAN